MKELFICILAIVFSWGAFADEYSDSIKRAFHFTYEAESIDISETAESALMWVPLPATTKLQTIKGVNIDTSHPYQIIVDEKYGNRFVRIELKNEDIQTLKSPPYIHVTFDVIRTSMSPMSTGFSMPNIDRSNMDRFMIDSTLVVSTGPVQVEAARIVSKEQDPLKQARKLYDNIVKTVTYDKSGDGWGRGDSLYACDVRSGNCTDFHSLFIGQARSLKIPARFIMGFPIPKNSKEGEISGYHCWAEFFHEEKGWLPLDASEAHKNPELRNAFFGGLDENRIQFTQGRDIELPMVKQGPLNYAIYPHVEVDGQLHTSVKTRFHFRELE